jgi:hypothetical protein
MKINTEFSRCGARLFVAIALVAATALPALAQTVYRSTLPDGRIIFSDTPRPNAATVETLDQSRISISGPSPAGAPATEGGPGGPGGERITSLGEADTALRAAQAALVQALQKQQEGKTPLPGERTGTVSGNSRLNDAYQERQLALQNAVEIAQKSVDEATARRNALR